MNSFCSECLFIIVNFGSFLFDFFELNFFGHVKGAFIGAYVMKKGFFEVVDKGMIFFDEIGIILFEI